MVSLFELLINYYVLAEYCTDHYGSDVSSQTGVSVRCFFRIGQRQFDAV
jgi:hypothetical protein